MTNQTSDDGRAINVSEAINVLAFIEQDRQSYLPLSHTYVSWAAFVSAGASLASSGSRRRIHRPGRGATCADRSRQRVIISQATELARQAGWTVLALAVDRMPEADTTQLSVLPCGYRTHR